MNINISVIFEEDKIVFYLNLPYELFKKNEEQFNLLDNEIIYKCYKSDIDYNLLMDKIKIILNHINEIFSINCKFHNFSIIENSMYNEDIYSFIRNNGSLSICYNTDNFIELINELKDDEYPNLKISFKNSEEDISYKEFYNMYMKLNQIKDFIKYYKLSPLEQIMLVYDIVKSNEYKKENDNESYNKSRDLNQIINNDKIVCVGFTNLIDFLLTNLGFNTGFITLDYDNENERHIRNYIHLKDDKYNIDNIFALDATWDSKKSNDYLDNYTYFLKPIRNFFYIKKNEEIIYPSYFEMLKHDKIKFIEEMKKIKEEDETKFALALSNFINRYNNEIVIFINFMNKSDEEINKILEDIYSKYNRKISENVFKSALYKVRRIEYLNKIINFIPDEEYIDSVCRKYYQITPEIKFLRAMEIIETPNLNKDLEEANASSVEEDLLRIRFLRALKNEINDFSENDYIKKM